MEAAAIITFALLFVHCPVNGGSPDRIFINTNDPSNSLCAMKFVLFKLARSSSVCPDNSYRKAYLSDMDTYFKALVNSGQKLPYDFNFLLGNNFANFSITADILYQHVDKRYLLRFETKPKTYNRAPYSLCVNVACQPTTPIPTQSTTASTPSKSTLNNSDRRIGNTGRYPFGLTSSTEREYQWFVATIFLSVLCFLLTCVILFLVYVLQKKKSKFKSLSTRRAKRPGELSNGVVHIPRPAHQQQNTDGCTFYGDIERRKQRSQELRRSHSETSSISGVTLPRGSHITGQSSLHTATLPLRHHNPYANTQHSQLTVHEANVQPEQPLLYNNNTIATVSTPRYDKFYNGLSVIGRHNNTLMIGEDSRRDPYVNGSIRAESHYACSSPNANISHLNEERHELL